MRATKWAAVLASAMIAAPAIGQEPLPGAAPAKPVASAEKKICRAIVPTGSIMAKRFCLTKTEWGEFNSENSKAVDAMINRPKANVSLLNNGL